MALHRSHFNGPLSLLDWEGLKYKVSTLEKYQNLTCNAIATQLVIVELINEKVIKQLMGSFSHLLLNVGFLGGVLGGKSLVHRMLARMSLGGRKRMWDQVRDCPAVFYAPVSSQLTLHRTLDPKWLGSSHAELKSQIVHKPSTRYGPSYKNNDLGLVALSLKTFSVELNKKPSTPRICAAHHISVLFFFSSKS